MVDSSGGVYPCSERCASATLDSALLPLHESGPMKFEILGDIRNVETIATGRGVYIRRHLDRRHGKGRWRKMKGTATIRLGDGTVGDAEIHWFEAHGIGRRDFKVKRVLR